MIRAKMYAQMLTLSAVSVLSLSIVLAFSGLTTADDHLTHHPGAEIELVGVTEIAGDGHDKSGLSEMLDEESSNDLVGGFSGLEYSGANDVYLFLSDRGPKDGAVKWACRMQRMSITIDPESTTPIKTNLLETTLLTDEAGQPYVGQATAFASDTGQPLRLDPEGLRVGPEGHFFVSDEYGPQLLEFSSTGQLVRKLPVPSKFLVKNPSGDSETENRLNTSGRQSNRGMEGLAISSDQKTLFGLLQSPLVQDCQRSSLAEYPQGLNCRLLQTSIAKGAEKEMLYPLEDIGNKLNEILEVGPNAFVVIERDGEAGLESQFKKLMLVQTQHATDISELEQLPAFDIPAHVVPVKKTVLIDLLDPRWKLAGEKMPEKIEGLAFGPDLPDGRRTLLICSDNDFVKENPSVLYVFAVPRSAFGLDSPVNSGLSEGALSDF